MLLQLEEITSATLVRRLRVQDADAWRCFCKLYGPVVLAWARRGGLTDQDAADVVQEVFQAVFTSLPSFQKKQPGDRFRDWLWTITRRRICDHFRKLTRAPVAEGGSGANERLLNFPADLSDDDSQVLPNAQAELVRRALDLIRGEFQERTWQACLKTAVEGIPPEEAGRQLGMSIGAVYVARTRVLRRLRELLEGWI